MYILSAHKYIMDESIIHQPNSFKVNVIGLNLIKKCPQNKKKIKKKVYNTSQSTDHTDHKIERISH